MLNSIVWKKDGFLRVHSFWELAFENFPSKGFNFGGPYSYHLHQGSLHFSRSSILGVSILGIFYFRAGSPPGWWPGEGISPWVSPWGRGHGEARSGQRCKYKSSEDGPVKD
jgi:hypothetical protein